MSIPTPASRAVILDVEGTTTSIAFVYDRLFPYVRRVIDGFLATHWGEPAVVGAVVALRRQAAEDRAAGFEGAVEVLGSPEATDERVRLSAVASVHWQMDHDRKTTSLKTLQGLIWRSGYRHGELQGHVYPDVPEALRRWKSAGVPVYIYSSGSIAAQKLLFSCSEAGDLTPLLAGHFDTTTGPKKAASSYVTIAEAIGLPPAAIGFATDSLEEARAAAEAGVRAVLSVRPGTETLPEGHGFPIIEGLDALDAVLEATL